MEENKDLGSQEIIMLLRVKKLLDIVYNNWNLLVFLKKIKKMI